tara:strand:+ start:817 stop:1218 length:402 start_codon:yes stop_codon:yes gene_type:complete
MNKTKKYFRKRTKTHKKKPHHKVKTHKRHKKKLMRKNKKHYRSCKSHKSKRYRSRGGGNFPYLPQGLVNSWWNLEQNFGKIGNNWKGIPSKPSIFPTDQPELIHHERPPIDIPDLNALNETAGIRAASVLNSN